MTISDHAPSENRFQSLVEASSMIDHKFDTFRSRDPDARQERGQAARRGTGDSLAELARLIGRDANGGRHNTHSPARSADGGFSGLNWAAEKAYPEQRQQGEVAPRRAHQSESYVAVPQERSNEKEPPPGRYFSGPADKFNGFHEDGEHPAAVDNVQYRDDRQPVSLGGDRRPPFFPSDRVPTFLLTASMADMMPIPSPPRLAKFTVPTIITLMSLTRAGGTVLSSWRCWLWRY
jgi:hypothetical protein